MSLEALFWDVDDFCQTFLPWEREQLACGKRKRRRSASLSVSEIMTVVIHFHPSHYRHFKGYYLGYVRAHLKRAFPGLVSYQRFVALIPSVLIPSLIETIHDPLKNISQIEHSRHRSIAHFMLAAGLIAYTHQPLKPSLNLTNQQLILLDKPNVFIQN